MRVVSGWGSSKSTDLYLQGNNKTLLGYGNVKLENGETDDPETIANHLNEFFAGVGESLSKKIPPSGKAPEDYLDPPQQNSFE